MGKAEIVRLRVLEEAMYVITHNATVRHTAKEVGFSKTTVYCDLTQKLPSIDYALYRATRKVSDMNKAERARRGGIARGKKYLT